MTPHEEMSRALRARELLDNELLQEALNAIESELIKKWEECPARDMEGKDYLWRLYKTAKKFRNVLAGYVEIGKMAEHAIEQEKEQGRLRRMLRLA